MIQTPEFPLIQPENPYLHLSLLINQIETVQKITLEYLDICFKLGLPVEMVLTGPGEVCLYLPPEKVVTKAISEVENIVWLKNGKGGKIYFFYRKSGITIGELNSLRLHLDQDPAHFENIIATIAENSGMEYLGYNTGVAVVLPKSKVPHKANESHQPVIDLDGKEYSFYFSWRIRCGSEFFRGDTALDSQTFVRVAVQFSRESKNNTATIEVSNADSGEIISTVQLAALSLENWQAGVKTIAELLKRRSEGEVTITAYQIIDSLYENGFDTVGFFKKGEKL